MNFFLNRLKFFGIFKFKFSSVICKWAHYEFKKKIDLIILDFLNSNFQVPPTIDDAMSNSDVIVREGSDLSFTCHARGSPTPTVKWRREDGRKISFNKSYSGEFIEIFIENFNEEFWGAVD